MILPALLSEKLNYCKQANSSLALFNLLKKHPPDLILFLESACADETWAENYEEFMKLGLGWAHQQFFEDNLLMEFAQRLAKVLKNHRSVARIHLPLNVKFKLKDGELSFNTLLYGASSYDLKDLIRSKCRDRKANVIELNEICLEVLQTIDEYITKGSVEGIYVKNQDTVKAVLRLSLNWNLAPLADECQRILKKWITRDNVVDTLIQAHQEGWVILRSTCSEYINLFEYEFQLIDTQSGQLGFEFFRFTEVSLEFFQKLKHVITLLVFSENTTADPFFSSVVNAAPQLICLNLSYSDSFTDYLKDIPQNLSELVLSSCRWVNQETFSQLIEYCPHLTRLVLTSNIHLNFVFWGELAKLKQLRNLDLTRCSQIGDEDLQLILQSCENLHSLTLEECEGITDRGFQAISEFHSHINDLNVARTEISDQPLIEIVHRCLHLSHLNLTRCEKVSEKSIFEVVRVAGVLQELNITQCKIPESVLDRLKVINPFVKIITSPTPFR